MTWPPTDAEEYRELRETEQPEVTVHPPACSNGWLGEDAEGRPVPCLVCRPHLTHHHATTRAEHPTREAHKEVSA